MPCMEYTRWVTGQVMLHIWNPEIWAWCNDKVMKRKNQLYYRAKGIVQHDRALNSRLDYEAIAANDGCSTR